MRSSQPPHDLAAWLQTPPGEYLLAWEHAQFAQQVGNLFGYHALQLGCPQLQALQANRMPFRWLALPPGPAAVPGQAAPALALGGPAVADAKVALWADPTALPFPDNSLDLVVLPHTLELSCDPHTTLREVARVLVPQGRVVISGLNPASLWGWRQRRAHWAQRMGVGRGRLFLPQEGEFIGYWRLRDWLRLLDFEVEAGQFGGYRPAFQNPKWLARFAWMDRVGARWWPILGAVYFVVGVKRVRGMRLIEPGKLSRKPAAVAPVTVARRGGNNP